jgi:hypothetical protein
MQGHCKALETRVARCSRPKHYEVADLVDRDVQALNRVVVMDIISSLHLLYWAGKLTGAHTPDLRKRRWRVALSIGFNDNLS